MIKKRWLKGLKPNGDKIGDYLSANYANMKRASNPLAGGGVDLVLSGEMARNIEMFEINDTTFFFASGVSYYQKIVEQFGLDNFNISNEEKETLSKVILYEVFSIILTNIYFR